MPLGWLKECAPETTLLAFQAVERLTLAIPKRARAEKRILNSTIAMPCCGPSGRACVRRSDVPEKRLWGSILPGRGGALHRGRCPREERANRKPRRRKSAHPEVALRGVLPRCCRGADACSISATERKTIGKSGGRGPACYHHSIVRGAIERAVVCNIVNYSPSPSREQCR